MWTLISAGASILASLLGIPQWLARRQARRQGQAEQKASDDAATVKESINATEIGDAVARLPDDALDNELRGPGAGR